MTRVGLTQRVVEVPDYGERRDCLDQTWVELLDNLGYEPVVLPNRIDEVRQYLTSLSLDGFILTSGNDLTTVENPSDPAPERDRFERSVLNFALEESIPVLGVCRGLELLNDYFGGSLIRINDHVATDHSVRFENTRNFDFLPDDATVNSYHNYGIDSEELANPLQAFAIASDDTIEGVMHPDHPFFGIMWHPERDPPMSDLDRAIISHLFGER